MTEYGAKVTKEKPPMDVTEIRFNIMESYKKPWNNHDEGGTCWCHPIETPLFLIHRNYEWRDNAWHAISERTASRRG